MKNRNMLSKLFILIAMVSVSQLSYSQYKYQEYNQHDRYKGNYAWKVNAQMSIINTNFSTSDPLNFDNAEMASLPKLSIEYLMSKNFSAKLGVVSNSIKEGQIVNGKAAINKFDVLNVDASLLYSIGGGLNIPVIDPYIETGFGYMDFNGDAKATYNLGGGINIWLSDTGLFSTGQYNRDLLINRFGLNLSALAKKNLSDGPGSNFEMSAGLFFVF